MKRLFLSSLYAATFPMIALISLSAKESNPRLVIPPVINVVAGVQSSVHFRSGILEESDDDYRLKVECEVGAGDEGGSWIFNASTPQAGDHVLKIELRSGVGELLDESKSVVRVATSDAGKGRKSCS